MTLDTATAVERLQATLDSMPPVAAMQIRVADFSAGALQLQAPLAANVNDKGNAFGGSLASVMTLAGIFLWPIWARAHAENDAGRAALAERYSRETLRLSMYGSLRPEAYPGIAKRLGVPRTGDSRSGA